MRLLFGQRWPVARDRGRGTHAKEGNIFRIQSCSLRSSVERLGDVVLAWTLVFEKARWFSRQAMANFNFQRPFVTFCSAGTGDKDSYSSSCSYLIKVRGIHGFRREAPIPGSGIFKARIGGLENNVS